MGSGDFLFRLTQNRTKVSSFKTRHNVQFYVSTISILVFLGIRLFESVSISVLPRLSYDRWSTFYFEFHLLSQMHSCYIRYATEQEINNPPS